MIESVYLNEFKGLTRRYKLDGPTLLLGRNGAGKTACQEALVYALTGRVPAGKSLDAVAQWFGPRGGYVRVHDAEGRWIQRGISRNHKSGSVSAILATSDDTEGQPPNLDAWRTADCTLDVREFLALSPDKRREYILRLVGGGTWTPETMDTLEREYAVALGGPGTPVTALTEPEALPADLAPVAEAWVGPRGVRDWIDLRLQRAKGTLSETIADLEALAKDEISSHRRAAAEGRAAAKELEAAAQGARVAAGEVARRQDEVEKARCAAKSRETYQSRRDQAAARVAETAAELTKAQEHVQGCCSATERASKAWVAAVEPKAPGEGGNPWTEKMMEARKKAGEAQVDRDRIRTLTEMLADNQRRLKALKAQLDEHDKMPLARLFFLVEALPDGVHESVPEIKKLTQTLAADWRKAREHVQEDAEKAESRIKELSEELKPYPSLEVARAAVEEATKAYLATQDGYNRAQNAILSSQHGYREARHAYEQLLATFTRAQAAEDEARKTLAKVEARHKQGWLDLCLADADLEKLPTAEVTAAALKDAEAAHQAALTAAGAVKAYADAIARAEDAETMEAACDTSGARIASVTSSPFSSNRELPGSSWMSAAAANCSSRSMSARSMPTRIAHKATARYIAPVSM